MTGGGCCTDTAQLHASLPSRRFASTVRRLGGLPRPGGRLAAALMLSESAVVDLAVGGFLAHIAFCCQVGGGGFVSVQPKTDMASRGGLYCYSPGPSSGDREAKSSCKPEAGLPRIRTPEP